MPVSKGRGWACEVRAEGEGRGWGRRGPDHPSSSPSASPTPFASEASGIFSPTPENAFADFYTDWCGPCKVLYPKYEALATETPNTTFLRFNCNADNKEKAKEVGIKAAPTFMFYKNGEKLGEVRGAKWDDVLAELAKNS